MPILVINDSPIKQFGENTHAVGAGTVESFIRITNRITNGRRVAVFGYGSVGRGVAAYFRGYNSIVSVIEPQPVLRLRALLDGFDVPDREAALREADIVVTVTGAPKVITADDLVLLRDGVVLVSAGHLPGARRAGARAASSVESVDEVTDRITTLHLRDGRRVTSDARPHGQPGRPATAGQLDRVDGPRVHAPARCLEAVAAGRAGAGAAWCRCGGHRRPGCVAVRGACARTLSKQASLRQGVARFNIGPAELFRSSSRDRPVHHRRSLRRPKPMPPAVARLRRRRRIHARCSRRDRLARGERSRGTSSTSAMRALGYPCPAERALRQASATQPRRRRPARSPRLAVGLVGEDDATRSPRRRRLSTFHAARTSASDATTRGSRR
jgi:hypothetical protein